MSENGTTGKSPKEVNTKLEGMPRQEPMLVEDFLLPSLNENRYPSVLQWEDPEEQIFWLRWNHKSSSIWTEEDSAVFTGWDKIKNRYTPEKKDYLMHSKQRFRAALHKLDKIKKLPSGNKAVKRFCIQRIGTSGRRRRRRASSRPAQELPNSPVPSENEVASMYSETVKDEQQLSPGSSSSGDLDLVPSDLELEDNCESVVPINFNGLLEAFVPGTVERVSENHAGVFQTSHFQELFPGTPPRISAEASHAQSNPEISNVGGASCMNLAEAERLRSHNIIDTPYVDFNDYIVLYPIVPTASMQEQCAVQQTSYSVMNDLNSYQIQVTSAATVGGWVDSTVDSTIASSDSALEMPLDRWEDDNFLPLGEEFLELDTLCLGGEVPSL